MLSKRLSEVNEELQKAESRGAAMSNELKNATQALQSEESKCSELTDKIRNLEQERDNVGSLMAKLADSTRKISELETLHSGATDQLKEFQEKQILKDKEIQVLFNPLLPKFTYVHVQKIS